MALDDLVRSAIATAHSVTVSLQATVTVRQWIGQDVYGKKTYATALTLPALVEQRLRQRQTSSGDLVMTRAKVTFLSPIPAQGSAGRTEPLDNRDKVTLPDGSTGPIVDVEGLVDPDTARPYMLEVWIGTGASNA